MTLTLLIAQRSMTRDGYAVVKVNYYCGYHRHIGNIFTVQVLFGFLADVEPNLISLISCTDAVGLLVLIPRYCYHGLFLPQIILKHLMEPSAVNLRCFSNSINSAFETSTTD